MSGPALLLLIPLLVWCGPGFLLSRWLAPRADPLQRAALSLTAGIVTVAPTTYLIALLGRIPALPELILAVAGVWTFVGFALARWAPRTPTDDFALPARSSGIMLALAVVWAGYLALATQPFAIEASEVWWHCPHLSSLYFMEDGHGPGVIAWDPDWDTPVLHLFQHATEPAYGIGPVLGIQRPGNTAFMVQILVFMSVSGHTAALLCTDFLILAFAMLLLGRYLKQPVLIVALAVGFHLGTRYLASYQVNENSLALALSMALLHLLLVTRSPGPVLAAACGVVAAHLAGVRPVTVLHSLPVLLLLPGLRPRGAYAVAGVLAAVPWMTAHWHGLGNPLAHPVIGRIYALNWPFADALVRSPMHPFPNLVRLPLEEIKAFGPLLLTPALAGLAALKGRRLAAILLWLVPVHVMLMAIVVLDYQKLSYALLALAPLPLLMGAGLGALDVPRPTRIGLAAAAVALFVGLPVLMQDAHFEVEQLAFGDYRDDPRDEWSDDEKRRALTTVGLLPAAPPNLADGLPGWALLEHARFASATEAANAPWDGPVTIWAALGESGLDHSVHLETSDGPRLPPGFVAGALHPDGNLAPGITLVVARLDAPAPTTATVAIRREGGELFVDVTRGPATVDAPRWVTALVVDRQHDYRAGALTIDGRRVRPFVAQLTYRREEGWLTSPRLIAHGADFAWTADGLTPGAPEPPPVRAGGTATRVCRLDLGEVFSEGRSRRLATHSGMLVGVATERGALSWGATPNPGDPCVRRWLAK